MARITVDQFPTVARSGRVSKYADQMKELHDLLAEPNFGEGQGLLFEISKDDLPALVSSLRKEAKDASRKVATVFKDGKLYVKDGGAIDSEAESATPIRAAVAAKSGNKAKAS